MVLSLSEADVSQTFDMTAGLKVVEESFEQLAMGQALLMPRVSQNLDGGVDLESYLLPYLRLNGLA